MPYFQKRVFEMRVTVASGVKIVDPSKVDSNILETDFEYFRVLEAREDIKLSPEATVIPVWKTPVCKRGILKHPVFNVLNFRGWIKRIFDTVD